jgi:hypothetical protein
LRKNLPEKDILPKKPAEKPSLDNVIKEMVSLSDTSLFFPAVHVNVIARVFLRG